jgi:carbon starvation protein
MGKIHKPLASARSLPANLGASAFIVLAWGYLVWGGSISTIWPLFGTANQLMAAIALTTMTTWLVNHGRAAYAWITALPAAFVLVTTITAAVLSTVNVYWPMTHRPGSEAQGWVQVALMSSFLIGSLVIIVSTSLRCFLTLRGVPPPSAEPDPFPGGSAVTQPAAPMRCC